jgi:hypothetical protein
MDRINESVPEENLDERSQPNDSLPPNRPDKAHVQKIVAKSKMTYRQGLQKSMPRRRKANW